MTTLARLYRLTRRFRRDRRGVALLEFAIVGPIFFVLIAATIETALVFFAGQALDTAVSSSTRLVRTGQAQTLDAEAYRDAICGRLYGMFDCEELRIVLRPLSEFGDFARSTPVEAASGEWAVSDAFSAGSANEVMVVEVYYKWPVIIPIPQVTIGLLPDNTRLLSTARIFMNEPFA